MKYSLVISSLLVLVHAVSLSAEETLPSDSADLLEKLESFEQETLNEAQKMIAEKRTAVAGVLRTHMERETRSGKLEAAIALKEEIERLDPGEKKEAISEPEMSEDEEVKNFVIGLIWDNGSDTTLQFMEDGTGTKTVGGKPQELSWTVADSMIVSTRAGADFSEYFLVDLRRKEFWRSNEDKEKVRKFEQKK